MNQWFKVKNEAGQDAVEILIYDRIGKSWWDDSGVADKEFTEALNAIPRDRKITLRINSQGGSVKDGLAIYNRLMERREKVTAIVDGYALSTASWIALAAGKTIIPENGAMMIHNPAVMAEGDADSLRKMAGVLDQHKAMIVAMYKAKTGKSEKVISAAMDAETWFVGKEAKDWGLADEVAPAVNIQNSFDLSCFRRVPAGLEGNPPPKNKTTIPTMEPNTQDTAPAISNAAAETPKTPSQAQLKPQQPQPADVSNDKPQAIGDANVIVLDNLKREVENLKAQRDTERKARIEREVDECINQNRIPAAQRDEWVKRCVADESLVNTLRSLPQNLPGGDPVMAVLEGGAESARDTLNEFGRLKGAAKSAFYNRHHEKLQLILNANTIPAELQRQAILQEMMRAFQKRLIGVRAFSTVHVNVPLEGTDKVNVPFYNLQTAASTDFNPANGYVMGNTVTSQREVTVNKRKYQGFDWTSSQFRRQPYLNTLQLGLTNAEKLAEDVWLDILSVITLANYGAAGHTGLASAFNSDAVANLKMTADQAQWPGVGRSLFLDSAYDNALMKDTGIKNSMNYGGSEAIRQGRIPQIYGFDYYENPNFPANAQNLKGWISFPSAILIATAPIAPTEEVRSQLSAYEVVVDSQTGLAFEYRRWGNPDFDTSRSVVECNYGFAPGNAAALKRIVSA